MNARVQSAVMLAIACLGLSACKDGATRAVTSGPSALDMRIADTTVIVPDAQWADTISDAQPLGPRVYFVASDGSLGGDGSRFRPYPDVQTAYATAVAGDIVQLLPGYYEDVGGPPDGVILQGSGSDVTVLEGPMRLEGIASELRELSIQGGAPTLTVVGESKIDTVVLSNGRGALVVQGELYARDLVIENVQERPGAVYDFQGAVPAEGSAVDVKEDAQFVWYGGRLENTPWTGVRTQGNTTLEGVDILETAGVGIMVEDGQCHVSSSSIRDVAISAILTTGGETRLTQAVLHAVRESPTSPLRSGVASYGGRVLVSESEISGVNRGIRLSRGTHLTINTLRIVDPQIDGISLDNATLVGDGLVVTSAGNTGVSVVNGGHAELTGLQISNTNRFGILVDGSTFQLAELVVIGSAGRGVGLLRSTGRLQNVQLSEVDNVGIQITDSTGDVRVEGGRIEDTRTSGIAVTGLMHEVGLVDLKISNITLGDAGLAEGIHLYQAHTYLEGVYSEDHDGAGVLVEFSRVRANGLNVARNGGPGIVLVDTLDGTLLNGVRSTDNAGAGVLVLQGTAQLADFLIESTRSDLAAGPGDGVAVGFGGHIELADGRSDVNQGHGISIQGATGVLRAGVSATDNRGWGLYRTCAEGELEIQTAPTFESNGLGDQVLCP